MENSKKVGIATTGALGIAGACAGKVISDQINTKRFNNVLNYSNVDQYVSARQDVAAEKLIGVLKGHKISEALSKVAEKAKEDYPKLLEKAKNTKIKWIAGLTAAGLALGTFVYNKAKAGKANKAE